MTLLAHFQRLADNIATQMNMPVTLNVKDPSHPGLIYVLLHGSFGQSRNEDIRNALGDVHAYIARHEGEIALFVHLPESIKGTPQDIPHDAGLRLDDAERTLRALGYLWIMGEWAAPTPAPTEPAPSHKLNATGSVAVATDVFWNRDMTTCPRGVKVQLLGVGGVATYGTYNGDKFWTDWAPVPRRRPEA